MRHHREIREIENFYTEESVVLREEEQILCDAETFTVHERNESALEIVKFIEEEPLCATKIGAFAAHNGYKKEDICEFLSEACQAGFLELI